MDIKFYIAYISPNNTTRTVAEAFAERLRESGQKVAILDLASQNGHSDFMAELTSDPCPCLLVGSPVYRDMAVPPVMAFIDALPEMNASWTVPFVTWGTACSGVALWQMGGALVEKGAQIAGAIKVGALHSLMWHCDVPEGLGLPGEGDLQKVQDLVGRLLAGLESGSLHGLSIETLDYQTEERAKEFKAKIAQPWMIIPKTVDENACTECGVCEEVCPVEAIGLDPLPVFADTCFDCFNCVRLCPENAIESKVPLEKIEAMIRGRVETINEKPLTQIYMNTD